MFKARSFLVLIVAINMAFVITACSGAAVPTISRATTPTTVATTVANTTPATTPTTVPTTPPTTEPTDVPDSTTVHGDLTTYTSPHYGFTVDYPTTWVLTPAKRDWPAYEGSYPGVDAVNQWAAPTSHPWILMFVLAQQLAKGQSASERIAKLDRENVSMCQLGHRHDVTIDGVAARQEDGKCFEHDYISEIATVHSGRFYFVYLLSGGPFSKTTLATFDHFVASFHFVGNSKTEANFPIGKFIKSGTTDYGLMFNADGTFQAFKGSNIFVHATYGVDGDTFTENTSEHGCPDVPRSFKYTFDGINLTFNYIGDPANDPCTARRGDFNNVTYHLVK